MGSVKNIILSAVTIALMGSAASASTYVLDFDANGPGSDLNLDSSSSQPVDVTGPDYTRLITDNGISWLLSTPDANGPVLFDTTCPYGNGSPGSGCNGDADLSPASQGENGVSGNILIQQNDNESRTPNDDPVTDYLKITLKSDVTLLWESISVIDDGMYEFLINISGIETNLGEVTLASNSETARVNVNAPLAMKMDDFIVIDFTRPGSSSGGDSGGVDSLVFNVVPAVPVPASLPLLAGGIGLMAFMRRRRKT